MLRAQTQNKFSIICPPGAFDITATIFQPLMRSPTAVRCLRAATSCSASNPPTPRPGTIPHVSPNQQPHWSSLPFLFSGLSFVHSISTLSSSGKTHPARTSSFYHHQNQRRHASSARRTTKKLRVPPAPSLVPGGLNSHSAMAGVDYADHIVFNPPSSVPSFHETPVIFMWKSDPRRQFYEANVKKALEANRGVSATPTNSSTTASNDPATNPDTANSTTSSSPPSTVPGSTASWVPSAYTAKPGVPAAGLSRYSSTTSAFSSSSSSSSSTTPAAAAAAAAAISQWPPIPTSSDELTPEEEASLPPRVRALKPKKYHLTPVDMAEMRRLRAEDPRTWTRKRLAEKFDCSNLFVGMVCKSPEMERERAAQHEANRQKWGRKKREAKEDRLKRKALWSRDC